MGTSASVGGARLCFSLNTANQTRDSVSWNVYKVCALLTYDPSASVGAHVTVDLQRLVLIPTQEDGVRARSTVTVQQNLGAVSGVSVLHTSYTQIERESERDRGKE